MLPVELQPRQFPGCSHLVASVHPRERAADSGGQAGDSSGGGLAGGQHVGDELLPGCWVFDELKSQKDVLRVTVNLSLVERLMGPGSAKTLRDVRRLTVTAFACIGADNPRTGHRIVEDLSEQVTGSKQVWPWTQPDRPGCTPVDHLDAAIRSAQQQRQAHDTRRAIRSFCFLMLLVAAMVYILFQKTTSAAPGRQRQ